jgi:hypothetical protein
VLDHPPGEAQIGQLRFGRRALRDGGERDGGE